MYVYIPTPVMASLFAALCWRWQSAGNATSGGPGFMFVAAENSRDWFYPFSQYGITPVPNAKFDLFYLFNSILQEQNKRLAADLAPFWPAPVTALATTALGGHTRSNSEFTFLSRFTDGHLFWFCGERGDVREDDPRLARVPQPLELLASDFFAPLRTPPPGRALAVYSLPEPGRARPLPVDDLPNGALPL